MGDTSGAAGGVGQECVCVNIIKIHCVCMICSEASS